MSGPKHVDIRVMDQIRKQQEEERQRKLEEERKRKERQQIQLVNGQIAISNEQLSSMRERLNRLSQKADTFAISVESHMPLHQEWELVKRRLQEAMQHTSLPSPEETLIELTVHYQKLKQILLELFNNLETLQDEVGILVEETNWYKDLSHEASYSERFEGTTRKEIKRLNLRAAMAEAVRARNAAKFLELQLKTYLDNPFFQRKQEVIELLESIRLIVNHSTWSDDDKYTQIERRRKAWETVMPVYEAETLAGETRWQSYLQHKATYLTLCDIVGFAEKSHVLFDHPPISEDVIRAIQVEIDLLENMWAMREEEEYITTNVQEVMNSLGFEHMATDVMKTPKRKLLHNMYAISEQEAVNVFVSDQGSIMFEVTGFSEGKKELTALERLRIKEAMDHFCSQYDEIKLELSRRGIHIQGEERKPSDDKYARSIDITTKRMVQDRKTVAARLKNKRQQQDQRRR